MVYESTGVRQAEPRGQVPDGKPSDLAQVVAAVGGVDDAEAGVEHRSEDAGDGVAVEGGWIVIFRRRRCDVPFLDVDPLQYPRSHERRQSHAGDTGAKVQTEHPHVVDGPDAFQERVQPRVGQPATVRQIHDVPEKTEFPVNHAAQTPVASRQTDQSAHSQFGIGIGRDPSIVQEPHNFLQRFAWQQHKRIAADLEIIIDDDASSSTFTLLLLFAPSSAAFLLLLLFAPSSTAFSSSAVSSFLPAASSSSGECPSRKRRTARRDPPFGARITISSHCGWLVGWCAAASLPPLAGCQLLFSCVRACVVHNEIPRGRQHGKAQQHAVVPYSSSSCAAIVRIQLGSGMRERRCRCGSSK